jgi:hypothetical protein
MCLYGKQEKSLIITEDIDFLDTAVYLFSWLEEEAARPSD